MEEPGSSRAWKDAELALRGSVGVVREASCCNCCSLGSKLHVVLRNMFSLSFYCDKLEMEKTPAHSSEHPKCLSSAEWSIFTQSLAQVWILGFTWGSQSSPVGAELLSGTEAMWLFLIKWIKDHRAGFKLLFLIYFFSFLVCIVWMMEWIRHIFSFTNGDHTLHKIILKLFSRNER